MDSVGDEKRIRALFSELSLEDQSSVPRFEELWRGARAARAVGPTFVRGFSRPALRIAVAVLVVAGCSLVAWSWYRTTRSSVQNSSTQNVGNLAPQEIPTPSSLPVRESVAQETIDRETAAPNRKSLPRHRKTMARLRPTGYTAIPERATIADRSAIRDASLFSQWQSPTEIFLESPAAIGFNSLPQLNQSVDQLKQFLPRDAELKKEPNQ